MSDAFTLMPPAPVPEPGAPLRRASLKQIAFDLPCPTCQKPFRLPAKDYARSQRTGARNFCSRACSRQKTGNAAQFDESVRTR